MRPIKFRAYCEQHQQMYLPSEKPNEFPQLLLNQHGDVIEFFPQEGCVEGSVPHGSLYFARVGHALTVMQSTGLLDRHGKEIYEGDVLRVHRGYQKNQEYKLVPEWGVHQAEVKYVDGCVIFKIGNEAIPLFRLEGKKCISIRVHEQSEILGNIYEQPELCEKHTPRRMDPAGEARDAAG